MNKEVIIDIENPKDNDLISRQDVLDEINRIGIKGFETYNDYSQLYDFVDTLPPVSPQQKPNIKALGEDIRICQKSITDKKILIGFNMAVALCNKHLAESEDKE